MQSEIVQAGRIMAQDFSASSLRQIADESEKRANWLRRYARPDVTKARDDEIIEAFQKMADSIRVILALQG